MKLKQENSQEKPTGKSDENKDCFIIQRDNQLFIVNKDEHIWLEFEISNNEKNKLLKTLFKDFLG